jgi:peptidyl-prolyl cis-trans isomerase SurA
LYSLACLQAQVLDKIVAIIDESIILESEIEEQYQYLVSKQGQKDDGTLRCTIFEGLLTNKLLLAKAQLDSLTVSPDQTEGEIDRRLSMMVMQFGGEKAFEKHYGKTLVEFRSELRPKIEEQLLIEQQKSKILANVKVTPREVEQFYRKIPKDSLPFLPSEVEVKHIIIKPKPSTESKNEARERLEAIRAEIVSGKQEFGIAAKTFSEDPGSAKQNGLLGEFGRGQMVPEFEEVAFGLNPGEISTVFETTFGYHIIQLLEKNETQIKAAHILIRPKINIEDEKPAIEKLTAIRRQILKDSITFEQAAGKYSDDIRSKDNGGQITTSQGENRIPLDQLDADLFFKIDTMKVGQLSEVLEVIHPQDGKCFQLILLKNKTQPHQANLKQDYQKFYNAAMQARQAEVLEEWFQTAKKQVYIEIKDNSCAQALQNWY